MVGSTKMVLCQMGLLLLEDVKNQQSRLRRQTRQRHPPVWMRDYVGSEEHGGNQLGIAGIVDGPEMDELDMGDGLNVADGVWMWADGV
ncbi:hypothetical protein OIU84_013643 [Salix udensis]|uniref:Uncharacterized protein n=1 Tax=Salix udensis TaxID=889485 RepID=A0AAD6NUR8_9ROSI|nr:hypothetical protein OIU84_013643 [Salix udensis]